MNCECFYVIKEGTIEAAKDFIERGNNYINRVGWGEWYPVYICKARKDFYACSDYDGYTTPYKVKKDSLMVFVQGKYRLICMVKLKGAKRGFPQRTRDDQEDFYNRFEEYIEDLECISDTQ